ncbi:MAG: hypothetical protein IPK81_01850 [Rhodospirillales bacterium]|nr:MAG: hypothetical protein IPK81_01850 [Rhodospirillales bacterium]
MTAPLLDIAELHKRFNVGARAAPGGACAMRLRGEEAPRRRCTRSTM